MIKKNIFYYKIYAEVGQTNQWTQCANPPHKFGSREIKLIFLLINNNNVF